MKSFSQNWIPSVLPGWAVTDTAFAVKWPTLSLPEHLGGMSSRLCLGCCLRNARAADFLLAGDTHHGAAWDGDPAAAAAAWERKP